MGERGQAGVVVAALFLASGIALGGHFIGRTMYNAKVAINTAQVKGLAERRVTADRADWKIVYRVSGSSRDEIPKLYAEAEKNRRRIVELLEQGGFEEDEIDPGVLDYNLREYRDKNQVVVDEVHTLAGTISVETKKIDIITAVRASINALIAEGIDIENHAPAYRFTKLNDIKPDMLREATRNARAAAGEFAKNAGVEVGGIRSARQGNFVVRDAGEDYGDTGKIEKDVRVVTTITFYLTG